MNISPMQVQRSVSLAIVAAILALVPATEVIWVFVVLGQAHFILGYWYKWKSGGIGSGTVLMYLLAIVFAISLVSVSNWSLPIVLCATGFIFSLHFTFDELFLMYKKVGVGELCAIASFTGSIASYVIDHFFGTTLFYYSLVFAATAIALSIFIAARKREVPWGQIWIYLLQTLVALEVMSGHFIIEQIFASIILFHVMQWYISSGIKYFHTARFVPYIRDCVVMNAVVIGAFVLYVTSREILLVDILGIFFMPVNFYLWSMLHIAFSVRLPARYVRMIERMYA